MIWNARGGAGAVLGPVNGVDSITDGMGWDETGDD